MPYIGKSPTGSGVRTRYYFTATGGETSLSGADDGGKTLTFSDGEYVDVYLNGVALVAGTDYGTATANTIGGLAALSGGDIVEVVVYDIYNVAKINSEAVRTRHYYTATGGETSIGTAQIPGLSFPGGTEIEVSLNGISLVQGTDYNTTSANTVGGLSALSAGNVVAIVLYEKFQLADTVSKAQGGTFAGDVIMGGTLGVTGAATLSSTVGIGTASPARALQVESTEIPFRIVSSDSTGNIEIGDSTGSVRFGSGASGAMRFLVGGAADFSGEAEKVRIDSDGLKFNADTAAANALDDYEEGTWTPVGDAASGGDPTFTTSGANYTRIGRTVHVTAIVTNVNTTPTTGNQVFRIGGLPYTPDTCDTFGSVVTSLIDMDNVTGSVVMADASADVLIFWNQRHDEAANPPQLGRTNIDHQHIIDDQSDFYFSITYYTNQ